MVVPVRILLEQSIAGGSTFLAHTLDANEGGARLGGVQEALDPGQTVIVQYQHRRARFRVAWRGEPESRTARQVGLECLEAGKGVWGIGFAKSREIGPQTELDSFARMDLLGRAG